MTSSVSSTWNYTLSEEMDFSSDISTIDRFGFSNQTNSAYTLTTSLDDLLITYKSYYDYTINAVDASDNVLKTFATGTYIEGDADISYSYPAKMLIGNTLYSIAYNSSNPRYTTSFTPDDDNYIKNVKYAESTVSNVICYMEAEDISGVSKGTNTNWASMNKYGYTTNSSTFVEVMTIPAGTYQIYARMDVGNAASNRYCKFKVGDEEKLSLNVNTQTVNNLGNSDEFTITSPTKLYFACDGGGSSGCDWFYIKGTIDKGADVTGLIVNPDMEIAESGSGYQETIKGWNNCSVVTNYRRLAFTDAQNPNGAFTGTYAYENWTGETGGLVGQMSQTINGLPNGVYKFQLAVLAQNVSGQFVYAKSNGKTYSTPLAGAGSVANDYEVIAVVEDNQLEIGLDMNGADNPWAAIDNARLTYAPSVDVTVGANGYTTFASTYALDLTDANRPTGLKAYKATLTGATLSFEALNQTVPAGTGLLLYGENKGSEAYNIPVVAEGTAVTTALTGVTTPTAKKSVTDNTYYFVMKKADSASDALEFAPLSTSAEVTIPAGKAYIEVANSAFSTARSLNISFDDETTGISEKLRVKSEGFATAVYNLNGQRVAAPAKGLYIMNGKKIIVK